MRPYRGQCDMASFLLFKGLVDAERLRRRLKPWSGKRVNSARDRPLFREAVRVKLA
jgi:hypothetical protein